MGPTRSHSTPPPGPVIIYLMELIEISKRKAAPSRRVLEITWRRLPPFVPPPRRRGVRREKVLAQKDAPPSPLLHFDELEPDRHDHEAEEDVRRAEDERAKAHETKGCLECRLTRHSVPNLWRSKWTPHLRWKKCGAPWRVR
jgi:hypothetical protein